MTVILDYPKTTDIPSLCKTYNGWANYQTWNVALWIQDDYTLYEIARECDSYKEFVDYIFTCGELETLDGVLYSDPRLDCESLDSVVEEIK